MTATKRPQKGCIFISYRRIDTSYAAGRIYDRLVAKFGEDAIFMDVDTIEGGTDFVKVLEDAVRSCDVLIALIGRQWLGIKDKDGKRRLDNPEDFVRIEIAAALERNIRVIPVLVDGVEMLQAYELPENLKAIARRNALQVNHHSFNPDVYRLIEHSESALDEAEESRVMKAQALQAVREKAAIEKTEREAAEKSVGEKAEREVVEKAARETADKEFAEKARLEAEELERQKAAREKADRQTAGTGKRKANESGLYWGIGFVVLVLASVFGLPPLIAQPETTPSVKNTESFKTFTVIPASKTPTLTFTPTPIVTVTPTPLPTEIIDAKDVSMLLVPASEFIMDDSILKYLADYYIDKYEVTNTLYRECVTAGICNQPRDNSSYTRNSYYDNFLFDDYPVFYVDWNQARQYCEWRGAKLPTDAQWEKAARGTDGRTYPWGEDISCSRANYFGCEGDTTAVGSYENGVSPYGAYDMAGNVWEWVDAGVESIKYVRGGAWNSYKVSLRTYYNSANNTNSDSSTFFYIGFRCAKDATP